MKKNMNEAVIRFEKVLAKLKEGAERARDELSNDGVVLRFEFLCELLWETLGLFLEKRGITVESPKEIIEEAGRLGWISDKQAFLNMLADRTSMFHMDSEHSAKQILEHIKYEYLGKMDDLFEVLKTQAKS